MVYIQGLREDDNFEDIDTDLEHGPIRDTEEAFNMINKKYYCGY